MEKSYQNMLAWIRGHALLEKSILFVAYYFPLLTFILYPCLILYLIFNQSSLLLESIIKPLTAFLLVTILRKIINRPRPYERMNIQPLFGHKKGESFPSRHAVSAFIIALICFHIHFYLGIIVLVIAILISLSRILCGVHYASDVVAAILIAIIVDII